MSTPPLPYDRKANFVSYEATNPTAPKRGTDLDAELDDIRRVVNAILDRLAEIQRDDGLLANESVHPDSLHPDTAAALAAGLDGVVSDAENARDIAVASASQAQGAAASATAAASGAGAAANAASTSAVAAASHASDADTARVQSQASALLSTQMANASPGVEVEPGLFSARHWAAAAQDAVTGALSYKGSWDASTGSYPPSPITGHLYIVRVAGTVAGTAYSVGDLIAYNGTSWDHIPNVQSVTSVAGRTGAVVLVASDITSGTFISARIPQLTIAKTTGLQAALDGKAPSSHSHTISDVGGLQSALDGKAATVHSHSIGQVTGLQAALDGKAASSHTHAIANVTGLQSALNAKFDTSTAVSQGLYATSGNPPTPADLNTQFGLDKPRFGRIIGSTANTPFSWGVFLQSAYSTTEGAQLAMSATTDELAWRRNSGQWLPIWHEGNLDPSSYVPRNSGASPVVINSDLRHDFNVGGTTEVRIQSGFFRRRNADSSLMTAQPRIFVTSTDPGDAAADGDLWFW